MTTKYLKITNKSGQVSRVSLEKLGLSTKRNDPDTIGQFGSGIKFAPIAALRKNWEWWFTGHDNNGPYKMQYKTQIEDGIECVVYDYGDYVKSSSFTIDAGVLSWVGTFQIYREAVSNALDEANSNDDWSISIVNADEISPVEGEFSVFITASPELVELNNDFDKYFCVNRHPIYSGTQAKFYNKIDSDLRIYSHGVLVHHDGECFALFDYDIPSVKLNEERNLSSLWDMEWVLTQSLFALDDPDMISYVIKKVMTNTQSFFEIDRMSMSYTHYTEPNVCWKEVFEEIYGTNVVIYDRQSENFGVENSIKIRGFNAVKILNDNFYRFLVSAGVKDYLSILGEVYDVSIDYDISKYPNVAIASRIAVSYIPYLKELMINEQFGVFESSIEKNLGLTLNPKGEMSDRKILVNKDHVNDNVEHILATIVHEYDHFMTGIHDAEYTLFRDLADQRIAKLMMDNYRPEFFFVKDGVIDFPIASIGTVIDNMNFSLTRIDSANIVILTVGSKLIKLNGDALYDGKEINSTISGVMVPSKSADSLIVNGLSNIKEAVNIG